MQYYAITKYNHSKVDPFAVIRLENGIIEIFINGVWAITTAYDSIFNGKFNEYELITESEANKSIESK